LKKFFFLLLICFNISLQAQDIKVASKVATDSIYNKPYIQFFKDYIRTADSNTEKSFWISGLRNKTYNYIPNFLKIPSQSVKDKNVSMIELYHFDSSLSYIKFALENKKTPDAISTITLKYYIVKKDGKLYFDNCMNYEFNTKFSKLETKHINIYQSSTNKLEVNAFDNINLTLDSLMIYLKLKPLTKKIDYYICTSEEELNHMHNIISWDKKYNVFTNNNEVYTLRNQSATHEFANILLGTNTSNSSLLKNGIITHLSGINPETKKSLKEYTKNSKDIFEEMLTPKPSRSQNLDFAFSASVVKYIIDNYGMEYFLHLYNDKQVTNKSLFQFICRDKKVTMENLKYDILFLIHN
jgi:hypothetical protein